MSNILSKFQIHENLFQDPDIAIYGHPLIWANRNRREKTFILCLFFSGKAKLVRAEKYRYHIVVKWYLLKMDLGFKFETK